MVTEYCEIHVDLKNLPNNIKIFSKNGKDATADREALHRCESTLTNLMYDLTRAALFGKLFVSVALTVLSSLSA